MMIPQSPDEIAAELRRRPQYAYDTALGMIGSIVRPTADRRGDSDSERLAQVAAVIAALDIVEEEELAIWVGSIVRYTADVIQDPKCRQPWIVRKIDARGVMTLEPAPGNDIDETSREVHRDELELVPGGVL